MVLARGVGQRLALSSRRRAAPVSAAASNRTSSTTSTSSERRRREGTPSLPWEDLSLNANAVRVSERDGGETEETTSTASRGQSFGCDLQENLFHVNVGKAITTLREEIPNVLETDLSYDIYTDDVAFVDELSPSFGWNSKTAAGKESYKRTTFGLRFHTWLFFSRAKVDVTRVWQPAEDVIAVRWTFRGLPRIIGGAFPGSTTYVDGISEFKVNRVGLIYEHKVDNLDKGGMQTSLQDLTQMLRGGLVAEGSWPTASYLVPIPVPVENESRRH